MNILAIETSCDETAAALLEFTEKAGKTQYRILTEKLHSQADLHNDYGGVFPTLAKREHQKILPLVVENIVNTSSIKKSDAAVITSTMREIYAREPDMLRTIESKFAGIQPANIDALAVTHGPGLAPALWVGVNFARTLSLLWDIPLIPVNHMEGHIVSALITDTEYLTPTYPLLALLVSGGHTELVLAEQEGMYRKVGQTLDDAAGEAFDKTARLLGLPYPGGPELAKLAHTAREKKLLPPTELPRPMLQEPSLNFSYAGLKTAVRVFCEKKQTLTEEEKAGLAMEFEDAVVETLINKTKQAIEHYMPKTVVLGGGVSANTQLKEDMYTLTNRYPEIYFHTSKPEHATDNACMIALVAYKNRDAATNTKTLKADANLSFPCD